MPSKTLQDRLYRLLGAFLTRPLEGFVPPATYSPCQLRAALQPGDVLLVEGNLRISSAIKYVTQSTWSHVALYVGPQSGAADDDPPVLVEAELGYGVTLSPLSKYVDFHTRICRAIGLRPDDRARVVGHALSRVGQAYDLRGVVDIARQRLSKARRRSAWGDAKAAGAAPTICSALIAQAFQSVRYPILPRRKFLPCRDGSGDCVEETWEARPPSLIAPRDFDVSPYFTVVKPPPVDDFDYTRLRWAS
jgi:hypothetical protein